MDEKRITICDGIGAIPENHTYIIAEAGNNHNGEVEKAFKLVDIAIDAGCDAVKFQKRDVDLMMTKEYMDRPFTNFHEWGDTYRKVREHIELGMEEFKKIKKYCKGKIDFIVTPFDIPSLNFLEKLGVDAYKIASFSVTDIPLLEVVAKTKKSVIVSLGMATENNILDVIEVLKDVDLALLHCISCYPMEAKDAHLRLISWLKKFGFPVGFSDHENGISLGGPAVTLGARFLEKHFTIDRTLPGFDHATSLEPLGLKRYVRNVRKTEQALSELKDRREILPCELKCFDTKIKSIVSTREIKKGTIITRDMLTIKAPNRGLPPRYIPQVVGKKAIEDIEEDMHITFGMVKI